MWDLDLLGLQGRLVGMGVMFVMGFSVFYVTDSSSEEDDDDDEEGAEGYRLGGSERLLSPALDESGLGLLARFAANAVPSPIIPPSLSIVQLEAKQKAKKKEERQSLMGTFAKAPGWNKEVPRFNFRASLGSQDTELEETPAANVELLLPSTAGGCMDQWP